MPYDIGQIESPSHKIYTKRTHSKATITLADKITHLDKNFILLLGLSDAHVPRMGVEIDESGHNSSMVSNKGG